MIYAYIAYKKFKEPPKDEIGETATQILCISDSTDKYESGRANPKIKTLIKIAEARELIERRKSGETLTNEEQQKILDYGNRIREDLENLPKFKETIKKFSNSVDKWGENILLANYKELNAEGKSEARKRVRELTEIPRYTSPTTPPQE